MRQQRPARKPATIDASFSLLHKRRMRQIINLYTAFVSAMKNAHLMLSAFVFKFVKFFIIFLGLKMYARFDRIYLIAKL